ncbi:translation termination factor eRF1 [Hypoxylon texense]
MAEDDSSDLSSISSLSSAPEDDGEIEVKREKGILKFFHKLPAGAKPAEPKKEMSPPPRKRSPSPAHEYVLADNSDIAFLVMFRSRFNDALPKSLANFGPQELERDVTEPVPGERAEHFLCAILSLLLNRKQDVKPGHYNRALEDAINSHKSQWARAWKDENPLAGTKSFATMDPTERLTLLRTLVVWTLSSSEVIKGIINKSYKGSRHEDDLNQPLSVQPWGSDSDKRRYYLIEGLDDTHFRVYRESNPQGFNRTWWSVAGSIDELKALADKLHNNDGGPKAKKLAQKMYSAVPRFEATEEKRKRREYRLMRKEQFKRPEPGFSMYEGRTRGKRMKYTYSDDEEFASDSTSVRRSTRNTRQPTPVEPAAPVTTASGRQIKAPSRMTVDASNNIVTTSPTTSQGHNEGIASKESSAGPTGRPRRSAAVNHGTNGWASSSKNTKNYNSADDEMEDYDDDDDSEPDLGDDEEDHVPDDSEEDEDEFDEDEEMVDDDLGNAKDSMMVKLKLPSKGAAADTNGSALNLDSYRYNGKKEGPSKSKSPSTGDNDIPEKDDLPEKSEEVISVATTRKQATPEKPTATSNDQQQLQRPPSTPALNSLQATSLAFRESPDKVQAQALPKAVDVGAGD